MDQNNRLDFSTDSIQSINFMLLTELNSLILSPEAGIQKIRRTLYRFGLDIPALYEASRDGDEVIFDVSDFFNQNDSDGNEEIVYLYFIYYQTDDGNYEFHAELIQPENLEDFLDDDIDEIDDQDSDDMESNAIPEFK